MVFAVSQHLRRRQHGAFEALRVFIIDDAAKRQLSDILLAAQLYIA